MKMKPTPKVNVQMLEPQTNGIRTIDTTGGKTDDNKFVMRRYVIMGIEFDNLWKPIELFVGENEFDILLTTDDFKDAAKYVDLESAEYVIEYLSKNYPDYSWHVIVSKITSI